MKQTLRHSNSLKSKNSAQINLLEDKLFKQLQTFQPLYQKQDDLDFKYIPDACDPFNDLIFRAKGLTAKNQQKIKKAKKQFRVSKKDGGTFLTGTGIYAIQDQQQAIQKEVIVQVQAEMDHDQMLKDLVNRNSHDDLEQLRRMIKVTGQNLDGYTRQVQRTKKDVMQAASQFNSPIDYGLSYSLNRIRAPKKKINSVAQIKGNRYY